MVILLICISFVGEIFLFSIDVKDLYFKFNF